MSSRTRVYLEIGAKRVFASAADWPGWCRPGKTEEAALEALATYAPRYAKVAKLARLPLPEGVTDFEVVERINGNATTDYGAPGIPARDEAQALTPKEMKRVTDLVAACWAYLDEVVERVPSALRKGPRGGGRDRDPMFDHVVRAETEYGKRVGVRIKLPDGRDRAAVRAFREVLLRRLAEPDLHEKWPAVYAARRTAWHALDHAWEMEDRIP